MSALAPSPAEQATIDRLGIWDEEKFAEIIEHADDEIGCEVCPRQAECRVICRGGCGNIHTACDRCLTRIRIRNVGVQLHCRCGFRPPATGLAAVAKVVPL